MSESVEQAALRRASEADWQGRARREAAALIAGAFPDTAWENYEAVVALVALGWLQGVNFGEHRTLGHTEQAFDRLRAAL